jgi:hypothetical protein
VKRLEQQLEQQIVEVNVRHQLLDHCYVGMVEMREKQEQKQDEVAAAARAAAIEEMQAHSDKLRAEAAKVRKGWFENIIISLLVALLL